MNARHILSTCALLAIPPAAYAQGVAASSQQRSGLDSVEVRTEIARVDRLINAALINRNREALEPLVADGFHWVHASDGRVESREAWLGNATRGMALSGQRQRRTEFGREIIFQPVGGAARSAVQIVRVQLMDSAATRESWIRQVRVYVREASDWKLALGQGTVMYEGPALDHSLHCRYTGTYEIPGRRPLVLTCQEGTLIAQFPDGAKKQIFLATPAEEARRTTDAGALRFTLDRHGNPIAASFIRGGREIWTGTRNGSAR